MLPAGKVFSGIS